MAVTPPPTAPASAPSPSPVPAALSPAPAPAQPKAPMIPTGIPTRTSGNLVQGLSRLPPAAQMPTPAPAGPQSAQPAQPAQPAPAAQPGAPTPESGVATSPTPPPTPPPMSPVPAPASSPTPGAGRGQPSPPASATVAGNAEPATPDTQAKPNWWDNYGITDMIEASGEAAGEMFNKAGDYVKNIFSGSEGQAVLEEAQAGGLSEVNQKKAFANAENEVGFEAAKNMWGQMTPWDHALLWGGAGIGILGLVNAMTGEGGIGSWIMGILGLLGAAVPLARHGVFGQGAQQLTSGLSDMGQQSLGIGSGSPEAVADEKGSPFAKHMGGALSLLTGAVGEEDANKILMSAINQYASPEQQQMLNRGAGVGGFGNMAMSWLGDLTGKTNRRMQDQYGFSPEQQEQIFNAVRQNYEVQQAAKNQP